MNFKRGYSRRQVRDTLATPHRWRGNAPERFDHVTRAALVDDEAMPGVQPVTRHRGRKRFVLQAKILASHNLMPAMASWYERRFTNWHTWSRYHTKRGAEQGMARALRENGHFLHFRVCEVG